MERKIIRTLTFTGKLSNQTHKNLDLFLEQQRQLHNAALEERIDAYQKRKLSITSYDQFKSLTTIRSECKGYNAFNVNHQRTALMRPGQGIQVFLPKSQERGEAGFSKIQAQGKGKKFRYSAAHNPFKKRMEFRHGKGDRSDKVQGNHRWNGETCSCLKDTEKGKGAGRCRKTNRHC